VSHKLCLPFLETMITQVCNLSCQGCTNYSDLNHSGYVSWDQGHEWLTDWLNVLDIPDFGIIGGEPLINPQCNLWLTGVRNMLPNSQIRFTTNGLLLDRNWHLLDLMHDLGNVSFKITVHRANDHLEELIKKIFSRYNWQPINEYGIDRFITDNNFRFHVKRPTSFIKTYKNDYKNMLPWGSDPNDAFLNCCQQTCPLMYQGRIYKCSTAGLLKDTIDKMVPHLLDQWERYIDSGIAPTDSGETIENFVNNFGKANKICGQCPTFNTTHSVVDHYSTVKFK